MRQAASIRLSARHLYTRPTPKTLVTVSWNRQASATLIFGSNPVFGLIAPTIFTLLSIYRLFGLLKPTDCPSQEQAEEEGNEMQMKECTQRLTEGVLAASGVQLAAI